MRWSVVALVGVCAVAAGYFVWAGVLEEDYTGEPPLQPLDAKALDGYVAQAGVDARVVSSLFVVDESLRAFAGDAVGTPADVVGRVRALVEKRDGALWAADESLPRPVYTAAQTLKAMEDGKGAASFYPLETAVVTVTALRAGGVPAMVAEVWGYEGEKSPPDPSGAFGYFAVALYQDEAGQGDPTFFDPYRGRASAPAADRVRVLKDTEAAAAALGIDASHLSAHGGDRAGALGKIQQALRLDPRSPCLRNIHASILMDSGGFEEAIAEVRSALQLRPEAPQEINMAQVHLTQASLFEMSGDLDSATREVEAAMQRIALALEDEPQYARAHLAMAMVQLATDEHELARVSLERAERFGPTASALPLVWAQYFVTVNETDRAIQYVERAIERSPNNWKLRLHAAQLLHSVGRYEQVQRYVGEALELAPDKDRAALRAQVSAALGPAALGDGVPVGGAPDLPDLDLGAPPQGDDPALMLGDPSKLRLREPGQELQLDLDD